METFATITGPDGPVTLTFGPNAIKSYCALLNCEPTIESVLANFKGGQQMEATCEIVRAGWEQTLRDEGNLTNVSDYEASRLMETGTNEEGIEVTKAFFSSVLQQDYDEWLKSKQLASVEQETSQKVGNNPFFLGVFSYN